MYLRVLAAAIVVVAVPIAVQGAEAPRRTPSALNKRTCEVDLPTGSRLGGIRRCRTKEEREAAKQEDRSTMERIQSSRQTGCPPAC
jgi:hypothetical protein